MMLIMNAATEKTFTLPSVGSIDIGTYFFLVKRGAGRLNVAAADSDVIMDSGAGGTIYCADSGFGSIELVLMSETQWVLRSQPANTWITTG
jgi:hypothetical protein